MTEEEIYDIISSGKENLEIFNNKELELKYNHIDRKIQLIHRYMYFLKHKVYSYYCFLKKNNSIIDAEKKLYDEFDNIADLEVRSLCKYAYSLNFSSLEQFILSMPLSVLNHYHYRLRNEYDKMYTTPKIEYYTDNSEFNLNSVRLHLDNNILSVISELDFKKTSVFNTEYINNRLNFMLCNCFELVRNQHITKIKFVFNNFVDTFKNGLSSNKDIVIIDTEDNLFWNENKFIDRIKLYIISYYFSTLKSKIYLTHRQRIALTLLKMLKSINNLNNLEKQINLCTLIF